MKVASIHQKRSSLTSSPWTIITEFFWWKWPAFIKKWSALPISKMHVGTTSPDFLWWKSPTFITTENFPSTLPVACFFANHRNPILYYPLGVHAAPNFFCRLVSNNDQRDCSSSFDESHWLSSHHPLFRSCELQSRGFLAAKKRNDILQWPMFWWKPPAFITEVLLTQRIYNLMPSAKKKNLSASHNFQNS